MKLLVRELPLFVLVGLTATACNYLGALAAQRFLGAGPLLAGFLGYLSAVGISYLGNSHLTFRRPVIHGPQFIRFAAISLTGLAINLSLVFVGVRVIGWPLSVALIPVAVVVPASTFVMSKFWAFRTPVPQPAE